MHLPEDLPQIPNRCPACDKVMYASVRLRPAPAMSGVARLALGLAGIVTAATFWAVVAGLREHLAVRTPLNSNFEMVHYPPTVFVSLISLPVALVPGVALGWFANRLPKVRRIRCRKCGWKENYPGNAKFQNVPDPAAGSRSSAWAGAWPKVVDDNQLMTQCWQWTYDEIRGGRSADEVARELFEQGWPAEEVDWMVDKCRREIRDRR